MFRSLFKSHPVFLAIVLVFLAVLPLLCMKDVSPSNELRYLSIADEAISEGNVFVFTNHGAVYTDKPPLYFWLLILSKLIFGKHCLFVLSMFSFIPAMVIIAVMDRWLMTAASITSLKFTPEVRFAGAMMTAGCLVFLGMGVILRMDMLMTLFIVLALYTFYKMYKGVGNGPAQSFLLPFYIFLALFTKGPVGFLMPVISIIFFLAIMGKIRDIGKYLGWKTWIVLFIFCGIWFIGVWAEGGTTVLKDMLFHQTFGRAIAAEYHREPIWFYFPALLYCMVPFSLLLILYLVKSFRSNGFVTDAEKLMTTSVTVTFIMLSCFSSKLAIYLIPLFPFLTYITVLADKRNGWNIGLAIVLWTTAIILLLACAVAFAIPSLTDKVPQLQPLARFGFINSPLAYIAVASITICDAAAIYYLIRKSWPGAVSATAMAVFSGVFIASFLLPQVNDYIGYRNLCSAASQVRESENLSGYYTLEVPRSENMDVFLGEKVVPFYDALDFLDSKVQSGVLMVRLSALDDSEELAEALSGKERTIVGDYGVWALCPDTESTDRTE